MERQLQTVEELPTDEASVRLGLADGDYVTLGNDADD